MRLLRGMASLLLTGLAVEIALIPFALYHFHRAGFTASSPTSSPSRWTTFVIMPLEAGALLLDAAGSGAPSLGGYRLGDRPLARPRARGRRHQGRGGHCCRPCRRGLLQRWSSAACGCACGPPSAPARDCSRSSSAQPAAAAAPTPDLLVTGDGQHLALVDGSGRPAMLRERSGDFVRSLISESIGFDGDPTALDDTALRALQPRRLHCRHPPRRAATGGCWRRGPATGSTGPTLTRPARRGYRRVRPLAAARRARRAG